MRQDVFVTGVGMIPFTKPGANLPHPQMAAGHVVGDDGKRWTITLRDGLRFHDGTPVLARTDLLVTVSSTAAAGQKP